jgi:SIR2-like domain
MRRNLDENDWARLLGRIRDGRCTPFLGAGACFGTLPLGRDIAEQWASQYNFPLGPEDSADLMRVAQFMAIDQDAMFPKERIADLIKVVAPPDFSVRSEAHGVLSDMPLPVFITTNYDNFMVKALQMRGKKPRQEICRWNKYVKDYPTVFGDSGFEPDQTNPVVFHLHGNTTLPESIVLTEDDYLDFLVNISRDQLMIPPRIQRALAGATLLFIGYRIADWNFRVLFRSLNSYFERALARGHVSVQIFPLGDEVTDATRQRALDYLDKYFRMLDTRVYWGTSQDFTAELRQRWEAFK